jgi:hypothetical protein
LRWYLTPVCLIGVLAFCCGCSSKTGPTGIEGQIGPQGPPGPIGPQGPPGTSQPQARAQTSWSDNFTLPCCTITSVPGSRFSATTSGGDLLIVMNLTGFGNSGGTAGFECYPLIDDQWAGSYSQLIDLERLGGREGVISTAGAGTPFRYGLSRIYPAVPQGTHDFQVQCSVTGLSNPVIAVCGPNSGPCNWGFIDLGRNPG